MIRVQEKVKVYLLDTVEAWTPSHLLPPLDPPVSDPPGSSMCVNHPGSASVTFTLDVSSLPLLDPLSLGSSPSPLRVKFLAP